MTHHGKELRGHRLCEAIADLARHGSDLTDPSVDRDIRADEASFHIGYLEEYCGFRLRVKDVMDAARRMSPPRVHAHS